MIVRLLRNKQGLKRLAASTHQYLNEALCHTSDFLHRPREGKHEFGHDADARPVPRSRIAIDKSTLGRPEDGLPVDDPVQC